MKKIIILLLIATPAMAQEPPIAAGAEVLAVANSYMGKRVSMGICWQFVQRVLKKSEATITINDTVAVPRPGDVYMTYGIYDSVVPILDKLGDCCAYRVWGYPPHIAIVSKNLGGNQCAIIEQNGYGSRDKVAIDTIDVYARKCQLSMGQYFIRPHFGEYTDNAKRLVKGGDPINPKKLSVFPIPGETCNEDWEKYFKEHEISVW